jgi:hypothetical protein
MATTSCPLGKYDLPLHHAGAVCMKEDHIYMGEWGWSWLGCCRVWLLFYLSRSSLKLYKLLCNGHNFPHWASKIDIYTILWKYV